MRFYKSPEGKLGEINISEIKLDNSPYAKVEKINAKYIVQKINATKKK